MSINDLVKKVLIELKYELDELPIPGTDENILKTKEKFEEDFNFTLPDQYIDLLKISDGVIFNGLTIWPTHKYWYFNENLIEANHNFRNSFSDKYIYFGSRDEELYVYSLNEGSYLAIEYAGESVWERFMGSQHMFEFMLERALD